MRDLTSNEQQLYEQLLKVINENCDSQIAQEIIAGVDDLVFQIIRTEELKNIKRIFKNVIKEI